MARFVHMHNPDSSNGGTRRGKEHVGTWDLSGSQGRIRKGGILLSVHGDTPEWCERAKKSLKDTGARSISPAAESAADFGTTDKPTGRAPVSIGNRGERPALPVTGAAVHEIRNQDGTNARIAQGTTSQ
jgi:hypothetical protein